MKTVLIADTLGMMPSRHLQNEYPNATFEVLEEARTLEPHGEMVCESFLQGHGKKDEVKILLYPHQQLADDNPLGWVDAIEAHDPDFANLSMGAWDQDDGMNALSLDLLFNRQAVDEAAEKLRDTNVFMASGNFNQNWDVDEDLASPQKQFARLDNIYLIGSATRNGFPARSSSDGPSIFCQSWGKNRRLWHPGRFRYVPASGTSFSSPFVMGIMARDFAGYRFERQEAMTWLLDRVTVAEGWVRGDRHPVAGFGDLTTYWEKTK